MDLRLPLKRKWFKMTKTVKKEDYREITPYWIKRLIDNPDNMFSLEEINMALCALRDGYTEEEVKDIYGVCFKNFEHNIMTLGYPKRDDFSRILKLEHKGISIGYGNPEWGAGPEICFIVKHGNLIK